MTYLLEIEQALPDRVQAGGGTVLPFHGWAWHPTARVTRAVLRVGGLAVPATYVDDLRLNVFSHFRQMGTLTPQAIASGFWGLLTLDGTLPEGRHEASVTVEWDDGHRETKQLYPMTVEAPRVARGALRPLAGGTGQPLMAICMATYNPPRKAFIKQIESIRAQTYTNWVCIIQDDRSNAAGAAMIREVVGDDARFQVEYNRRNAGPYRNFERTLERVPAEAAYVALSDQDDIWLPHKLTTLVEKLEAENALLAYSDQRIVMADGRVIADTYWTTRRNEYKNLADLLVANTVTGAASVFKRALLDIALPFPPKVGSCYHDHWLGLCALTAGRIAYVDAPLYDYVQHGGNVLGHSPFSWRDQARLATSVFGLLPAAVVALFVRRLRPKVRSVLASFSGIYENECRRLIVFARILRLRVKNLSPEKVEALEMFTPRMENHGRLLAHGLFGGRRYVTTNNAELRLWSAFAVERTTARWAPRLLRLWLRARAGAPAWLSPTGDATKDAGHVAAKIAPLKIEVRADVPKRVNIVMPELNVATFFGGYMAKINLAARLAARGHAVRLLLVDQITCNPDHLNTIQREYCINENIFDDIDVEESWDRKRPVTVSPNDVFIATTFWTAHIVNAALREIGHSRFLYLIQEYEPFTFAMSSFHAVAHASYSFDHDALFSTRLLEEYFENQAVGVFAPERRGKSQHRSFDNAIVRPPTDRARAPGRRKQLVFYARPEGHAARNLFEIGWTALRIAIEKGILAEGEWEITTIGSPLLPPELAGRLITNLGKKNLKEYRELLQDYDVGMSLMYTPHPSLVPLEMAAAGMVVVTTTCLNKTEEKLHALSPNFIGAAPSIEGVVEGLARAVADVTANPREARLNKVNWPFSWQESFSDDVMAYVEACLDRQSPAAQAGVNRTLAS